MDGSQNFVPHMQPQHIEILELLLKRDEVARASLIQRMYVDHGIDEPDGAATVLRLRLHQLRKKLEPFGVEIKYRRGFERYSTFYRIDADQKEVAWELLHKSLDQSFDLHKRYRSGTGSKKMMTDMCCPTCGQLLP